MTAKAPPRKPVLPPLPASLSPASSELSCAYELVDALTQGDKNPTCSQSSSDPSIAGAPAPLVAMAALSAVLQRKDRELNVGRALAALVVELPSRQLLDFVTKDAAACDAKTNPEGCAKRHESYVPALGGALHAVQLSLHACSTDTTTDNGYAPWRQLCQAHLDRLEGELKADPSLQDALNVYRGKARELAAGPRPEGPEACWQPAIPAPSPKTEAKCDAAALPPSAAPWQAPPSLEQEFAGTWARDHRYGPLDATSQVRVSLAAAQIAAPTKAAQAAAAPKHLDASALTGNTLHSALASCFAADAALDKTQTLALEARVDLDARAKVQKVAVSPLDPAAPAPSKTLTECVSGALRALPALCGSERTAVKVTLCMRHDPEAHP